MLIPNHNNPASATATKVRQAAIDPPVVTTRSRRRERRGMTIACNSSYSASWAEFRVGHVERVVVPLRWRRTSAKDCGASGNWTISSTCSLRLSQGDRKNPLRFKWPFVTVRERKLLILIPTRHHSGCRQRARHSGDSRRLRRRDDRLGRCHDRCAANGEMDRGRDRRRRRRRTDPRVDRDSSGPFDRFDRRPWQFRHRHGGAWRRRPDFLPGACGPRRRDRAGRAFHVRGHTSHPAAISGRQILDRRDVAAPPLALLGRRTTGRLSVDAEANRLTAHHSHLRRVTQIETRQPLDLLVLER
jgi:hypothetical protein